jgi:oligopeptide transport system permease protein
MINLIIRRLIQLPIILLIIYTVTFFLAWALPGSAVINDEGRQPPAAVLEAMERQYNLDDPAKFYFDYLYNVSGAMWTVEAINGSGGAAGSGGAPFFNFGPTFRYEDWTVNDLIAGSLPISIVLGLSAILIALVVGITAGVVGAVKPNSPADLATLLVALIGISMPSFVVGTLLLMIFPVWLGVGTVAGWGSLSDIWLPALTLSLPFAAYIARLTRMGMIESLNTDYVRTARAKGVAEHKVILKHALKNAFLPVLSYLGPAAAFAMTGSFVVEQVFAVPGIGQHFVNGVRNKDLFVILGVTLVFATLLVLMNLAVDVLYRWIDPRIDNA